jgi:hypothetical protein
LIIPEFVVDASGNYVIVERLTPPRRHLLENARHSKAQKVWIRLRAQEGMVVLEVEDNGVGISPEAISQGRRSGFSACVNGLRYLVARSRSGEYPVKEQRFLCACLLMDQPADENSDR